MDAPTDNREAEGRECSYRVVGAVRRRSQTRYSFRIADRQAPQKPQNDQRLQRMRARDALAEHLTLEPQLAHRPDPRALELHRPARRLDRPGLVAVAVDRAGVAVTVVGTGVARAAEELGHLVLERLLQMIRPGGAGSSGQPGATGGDRRHRLHRVGVLSPAPGTCGALFGALTLNLVDDERGRWRACSLPGACITSCGVNGRSSSICR